MFKILLALLLLADIGNLIILITGAIISIKAGSINVLLPGLGLIISLPFILVCLFLVETLLVAATYFLFRQIRKDSEKLA